MGQSLFHPSYSTAGLQDRVGAGEADSDSEEENDDVFRTSGAASSGNDLDRSKSPESQEEDQEEDGYENEEDEEYVLSVGKRTKTKEVAVQAPGSRERKKPKLEGTTAQVSKKRAPRRRVEKDDEEFVVGDDEVIDGNKSAAAPSTTRKTSHSKSKPSTTATASGGNAKDVTPVEAQPPVEVPDAPATDRVRAHVVKQLHAIFLSIFSASTDVPPEFHSNEDRATSFATDVEADLFQGFAEVDLKAHVRGPRAKYSSKFRSLHYNLKTNVNFRERIAANELSSMQIMAMTNEDLMRPELKKMAESVRAASLKHSVKEVIGVPTAKRTHKGEEEIGTDASQRLVEEEEIAFAQHEHKRSTSISENVLGRTAQLNPRAISPIEGRMSPPAGSRAMSPLRYGSGSPPPQQMRSPIIRETSPIITPVSASRSGKDSVPVPPTSVGFNEGIGGAQSPVPDRRDSFGPAGSPPPTDRRSLDSPVVDASPFPVAQAPRQRQRSSFDMASIWNKVKASPKSDAEQVEKVPEQTATDDAVMSVLDELKATVVPAPSASSEEPKIPTYVDDDDFEDELFGTTAKGKARKRALPASVAELVDTSTVVWNNDFFVPEEGGFPAYAVQVGGRPLGVDRKAWSRILPQRPWTTAGRLSSDQAFKYLLDCWGSSKRELIVLGVMPDLKGPTPESPHRPTKEKCLFKHQHVVDFHLRIDRVGVVPPKEVKDLVKDLYIVPLRKDAPLPEFLQVLDNCNVPQTRESDLLLAVLVIQKNALPTVQAPVSTADPKTASPAPAPSSRSPLPPPSTVALNSSAPTTTIPPTASTPAAGALPAFDAASLASLSSLLSNPSLIHSLASASAAPPSTNASGPSNFIPPPPPPGFVPPPGFSPLPPNRGTNSGWSSSNGAVQSSAPLGSVSPYGSSTPQWNGNKNNVSGGYSPHAIRDGRSPMHHSTSSTSTSSMGQGSGGPRAAPLSNTGGIHPSRLALLEGAGKEGGSGRDYNALRDGGSGSYRGGDRGQGWGGRGRRGGGGSRGGR
ncbi:BQ2448_4871 [Microbotryum intermedium]|uniref:BQ2448_4871 protein n=1 Tax=Microbotryum intermedium TaxID=269621 RepID=A0A238FG13_9BASI|nr:BQ2448_4871 [Microbotryum intermedium]